MSLAKEIADLLYRHDCVIVPDFGGFLGQYKPARLQRELKRILPPGKELGFNRELTRNDGLLADRISSSHKLVYAESIKHISMHVKAWEQELAEKGRLELPELGIFLRDTDGKLIFTPDQKAYFAIDSFGLRPAKAIPVETAAVIAPIEAPIIETLVIPMPVISQEEEVLETEKRSGALRYWGAAAAAALILTTVGIGLFSSELGTSSQLAKLWPNTSDSLSQFEERTNATIEEKGKQDIAIDSIVELANRFDVTGDGEVEHPLERIVSEAVVESTYVAPVYVSGPYHVVIGCFGVLENAEGLVADFEKKGLHARILDQHKGLFRVVISSYADRGAAVEKLKAVKRSESKEAWLLKK